MELPIELSIALQSLIVAGMTWLVVAGFKGLGEAFGTDFSKLSKTIATVLAGSAVSAVFGLVDLGLASIPVDYIPVVQGTLSLLVTILAAMGVQRETKK